MTRWVVIAGVIALASTSAMAQDLGEQERQEKNDAWRAARKEVMAERRSLGVAAAMEQAADRRARIKERREPWPTIILVPYVVPRYRPAWHDEFWSDGSLSHRHW